MCVYISHNALILLNAAAQDNVTISIDGVLYLRVVDAVEASYGVNDPIFAVMQLAQAGIQ